MAMFRNRADALAYVERIPFLEARWYHPGRLATVDFLVVHTMENTEASDKAEQWQAMTATQDRESSVHCGVDNDSTRMAVHHWDTAYHVGKGNRNTWGCEHAGRAAQASADWSDPYSRAMLEGQSAPLFAAMCLIADIPIRRANTFDYMASRPDLGGMGWHEGRRGILGHVDVARAIQRFGLSDSGHTDPGEQFPYPWFLDRVRSHLEDDDMTPEQYLEMMKTKDYKDRMKVIVDDVVEARIGNVAKKPGTVSTVYEAARQAIRDTPPKS